MHLGLITCSTSDSLDQGRQYQAAHLMITQLMKLPIVMLMGGQVKTSRAKHP